MTSLDSAKVTLIETVIHSLENGSLDEDISRELRACMTITKTIKQPFERRLLEQQLNDMIRERVTIKVEC